jgi:hypothetical protein
LYAVAVASPTSSKLRAVAATVVLTAAKFEQLAPWQRSTSKPVAVLSLKVHDKLILFVSAALAVRFVGAGSGPGGGGGGCDVIGFVLSLHAPNAAITPPAVNTNAARIIKRGVTFIPLSLCRTCLQ